MGLTGYERGRLRYLWRELARQTLVVARDHLAEPAGWRASAHQATEWQSPLDDYADACVLFGFARLVDARTKTKVRDFPARAPALIATATLVLEIIGDAPAPSAPRDEPPRLPFRADIDG